MIYGKAKLVNGQIVITDQKEIDQSTLTADCLLIQIEGAKACETCQYLNKPRLCGGMRLREKYGVPPPVTRRRKKMCGECGTKYFPDEGHSCKT